MRELANISQFENLSKTCSSFDCKNITLFNGFLGSFVRKASGQERREREQEEERLKQIEENRRLGWEKQKKREQQEVEWARKQRENEQHLATIMSMAEKAIGPEKLSTIKDFIEDEWWGRSDLPDEDAFAKYLNDSLPVYELADDLAYLGPYGDEASWHRWGSEEEEEDYGSDAWELASPNWNDWGLRDVVGCIRKLQDIANDEHLDSSVRELANGFADSYEEALKTDCSDWYAEDIENIIYDRDRYPVY